MAGRLIIDLPPGWSELENPDVPLSFVREASASPGVLQISPAWYTSGAEPNPSDDDLIDLAAAVADSFDSAECLETNSGSCAVGRFGTAVFCCKSFPRVQAWHLSNGRDFVMVTYISGDYPDSDENGEVTRIVAAIEIDETNA